MKPFISLCMIVKNEEKVLARCLDSVKDVVDEIVVVDTGSTDRTKEIILNYLPQFYEFKWTDSFAEARNFAQSKATGEWILVMDADEYVYSENLKEVINELKVHEKSIEALEVKVFNFAGVYGERIMQNSSIRIFKNCTDISYSRGIHEQVTKNNGNLNSIASDLIIYHSGYLSKTIIEKNKSERNGNLIEKEISQNGYTAFDYFNLGNEYGVLGKTEKALNAYISAYQKKPDFRYSWVSFCIIQIINCLITLKKYNDALNVIQDAELIYENSPDFKCLKSNIYLLQNRNYDALEPLLEILDNNEEYSHCITSIDFKEYYPHQMLGSIYKQLRNHDKSVYHYVKALNVNQYCTKSLFNLFGILSEECTIEEIDLFIHENGFIKSDKDIFKFVILFIYLSKNDLASKYIKLIQNDSLMKKGLKIKLDFAFSDGMLLSKFLNEATLEELNNMIGNNYFDINDIFLFTVINKDESLALLLSNLIKEEKQKDLLNLLFSDVSPTSLIKDDFLLLIERTLQYKNLELFNNVVAKAFLFDDIYLSIGHLLYQYNYKREALNYYGKVEINCYDDQTFVNYVRYYIEEQRDYKIALKWINDAFINGKRDYRLFEYAIELQIEGKENHLWNIDTIVNMAFQEYPRSENLTYLKSEIQNHYLNLEGQSKPLYTVGFFLETTFHYFVYESIIDELVKKGINCHLVINDHYQNNSEMSYMYDDLLKYIENLDRNDIEAYTISTIRENQFVYDCMISCYYTEWLQDITRKQVRVMYSLAKDYWTYSWWNVFYDKILCYGEYDFKKLNINNNCSIVGIPKFDKWYRKEINNIEQVKEKFILDNNKQTILYAPTYGHLSSIDEWIDEINNLQEDFNVIVKLHNGTAYRESEQYRRELLIQKFNNITSNPEDLFALFSLSEFVITDNSGMIFDAMLAEKNILLLNSDFQPNVEKASTEQQIRKNLINIDRGMDIKGHLSNKELLENQKRIISTIVKRYYKLTGGNSGKLAAEEIYKILIDNENNENTLLASLRKRIFGN
jgi:glycosyltransferase involved in cell wall biosynthesis